MVKDYYLVKGNIKIRPYTLLDINGHIEAIRESVESLRKWFTWCDFDYSIDRSTQFITRTCPIDRYKGNRYHFAIIDMFTGLFFGNCCLIIDIYKIKLAYMSYWIRSRYTGCGIATNATYLLAQFGFQVLKLKQIETKIAKFNEASQRVVENIGSRCVNTKCSTRVIGCEYGAKLYILRQPDLVDKYQGTSSGGYRFSCI